MEPLSARSKFIYRDGVIGGKKHQTVGIFKNSLIGTLPHAGTLLPQLRRQNFSNQQLHYATAPFRLMGVR